MDVPGVCSRKDDTRSIKRLLLRVAHGYTASAATHSVHARVVGDTFVHRGVGSIDDMMLVVTDDGWGFHDNTDAYDGWKVEGERAAIAGQDQLGTNHGNNRRAIWRPDSHLGSSRSPRPSAGSWTDVPSRLRHTRLGWPNGACYDVPVTTGTT